MKSLIFVLFSAVRVTVAISDDAKPIPGTKLLTNTFYRLSLKDFPGGVFTYMYINYNVDKDYYVEVDNKPENEPLYERGGKWYNQSQWEFIPATCCDGEGWYKLRNKDAEMAGSFVTWGTTEFVEGPGQTMYIQLHNNAKGIRSEHDFLVKPVLAKYKEVDFYQLKFKGLPKAVVTYSNKTYEDVNRYIMADNSRDPKRMANYTLGPDGNDIWYGSTLFGFDMPVFYL